MNLQSFYLEHPVIFVAILAYLFVGILICTVGIIETLEGPYDDSIKWYTILWTIFLCIFLMPGLAVVLMIVWSIRDLYKVVKKNL